MHKISSGSDFNSVAKPRGTSGAGQRMFRTIFFVDLRTTRSEQCDHDDGTMTDDEHGHRVGQPKVTAAPGAGAISSGSPRTCRPRPATTVHRRTPVPRWQVDEQVESHNPFSRRRLRRRDGAARQAVPINRDPLRCTTRVTSGRTGCGAGCDPSRHYAQPRISRDAIGSVHDYHTWWGTALEDRAHLVSSHDDIGQPRQHRPALQIERGQHHTVCRVLPRTELSPHPRSNP